MKKVLSIIPFVMVLTILTGCWDRREINELSVAVGLGIDKNEEQGYTISIQVLNPSETSAPTTGGSSGYDTPVTTYTMTGEVLFEALRKLTQEVPRKIFVDHLRIVVLGEELAKDDIYDVLDFLSRNPKMRTDFYTIVSKESTAEQILKVLTNIEKIPAGKILAALESSSSSWASTRKVYLEELINDITGEGVEPTLPAIKLLGEIDPTLENIQRVDANTILTFDGMAAFRKNKLVGWLNQNESKGLSFIKGEVKNTVIITKVNNDNVAIELLHSETELIPHLDASSSPTIEVKVTGEANIADVSTNLNLTKGHVFKELENKTNKEIKNIITKALTKAQKEYQSDIFGFGNQIHKKEPKYWKEIKSDWQEIFPNIKVDINVDIKINGTGSIINPFYTDIKD